MNLSFRRTRNVAALAIIAALTCSTATFAADPTAKNVAQAAHINNTVPIYSHHIVIVRDLTSPGPGHCGAGAYAIETTDPMPTVMAFYRSHLKHGGQEVASADSSRFFSKGASGVTVLTVRLGLPFNHNTQVLVGPC